MADRLTVLGFMSGTSLDGIDMAILHTDGKGVVDAGPTQSVPMPPPVREALQDAIITAKATPSGADVPPLFPIVSRLVAQAHAQAAQAFLDVHNMSTKDIDLIGFHGVTVLHERPRGNKSGRTIQLGDAQLLADLMGCDVVHNFRQADVKAGGEGAPFAPIYHKALVAAHNQPQPVVVVNWGGVANITIVSETDDLLAFDVGPANGLLDSWVQHHGLGEYDDSGVLAAAGQVDTAALTALQSHPYFQELPPKSLDRYDFNLDPVMALRPEDGAATLAAFTVWATAEPIRTLSTPPQAVIVCGGGRHNPVLMSQLQTNLPETHVIAAEDAGWRGDSLEAEAFAYLAARSVFKLALSFPGTTGVPRPTMGGQLVSPKPQMAN